MGSVSRFDHTPVDPALVARAQDADPDVREPACAEVIELLAPLVDQVLSRLRTPRHLRGDALQEGVLGVLEALRRFEPSRGIPFALFAYPFVLGCVRGLVHPAPSHVPKSSMMRSLHYGERPRDADDSDIYEGDLPDPFAKQPVDSVIKVEIGAVVRLFIDGLAPQQRQLVRLCFWGGRSQTTAARELGCSAMTASRLMSSVRVAGRRCLADVAA